MKMEMNTFADRVIGFNKQLFYPETLPTGFQVMNPYLDNPETLEVMQLFYKRFYNDNLQRKFIIGINPGRYGAGVTGVPFTDTKRLESVCGIPMKSVQSHEVSSVFVYDMIDRYGGTTAFYDKFYINSLFPLALIRENAQGNWRNANYYDYPPLFEEMRPFMIDCLTKQIALGIDTTEAFVLGVKNAGYVERLNKEAKLFERLTVLEHPRYIQQYKTKERDQYIMRYIEKLNH